MLVGVGIATGWTGVGLSAAAGGFIAIGTAMSMYAVDPYADEDWWV